MAVENLSSALRTPASSRPYPKAQRGYGKRSVPDQRPARDGDFKLLPERERYIAGYIDRLPEGSAMDIKSLAKSLPLYGQMAVGSALRALSVAGYLRRVRCRACGGGPSRWVTLTFWSRTAHDNEWWDTFFAAENNRPATTVEAASATLPSPWAPIETPAPPVAVAEASSLVAPPAPAAPAPSAPRQRSADAATGRRSPAYLALAGLGRVDHRLGLSTSDCGVLEELAAAWLERGVDTGYLTHALVSGLPAQVGSPVGFVRRRLIDKIPPHLPAAPEPATPDATVRQTMPECTQCGTPGPSEALPDGLCRPCRTPAPEADRTAPADPPVERDIHALVDNLRNLMKQP